MRPQSVRSSDAQEWLCHLKGLVEKSLREAFDEVDRVAALQ